MAPMKAMKAMKAMKTVHAMKAVTKAATVVGGDTDKKVTKTVLKKKPAASAKLKIHVENNKEEMTTAEKIKMLQAKANANQDNVLNQKIEKYKAGKLDEGSFAKEDMHKLWARLKTAREQVYMLHQMCF